MSKDADQAKRDELAKRKNMSGAEKLAEYEQTMGTRGRIKDLPATLSCSAEISKKILIAMNVLFLIFAVIILAVGAYALNAENPIYKESGLPTGIMVLGGLVLVLAFLGCFGALQENRVLLLLYAVLLVILIICQLAVAGVLLADRGSLEEYLKEQWAKASVAVKKEVQDDFECCGLNSYNDANITCPRTASEACLPLLETEINNRVSLLGGLGIFFAVMELFGVLFALVLRAGVLGTYTFQ